MYFFYLFFLIIHSHLTTSRSWVMSGFILKSDFFTPSEHFKGLVNIFNSFTYN